MASILEPCAKGSHQHSDQTLINWPTLKSIMLSPNPVDGHTCRARMMYPGSMPLDATSSLVMSLIFLSCDLLPSTRAMSRNVLPVAQYTNFTYFPLC